MGRVSTRPLFFALARHGDDPAVEGLSLLGRVGGAGGEEADAFGGEPVGRDVEILDQGRADGAGAVSRQGDVGLQGPVIVGVANEDHPEGRVGAEGLRQRREGGDGGGAEAAFAGGEVDAFENHAARLRQRGGEIVRGHRRVGSGALHGLGDRKRQGGILRRLLRRGEGAGGGVGRAHLDRLDVAAAGRAGDDQRQVGARRVLPQRREVAEIGQVEFHRRRRQDAGVEAEVEATAGAARAFEEDLEALRGELRAQGAHHGKRCGTVGRQLPGAQGHRALEIQRRLRLGREAADGHAVGARVLGDFGRRARAARQLQRDLGRRGGGECREERREGEARGGHLPRAW